MNVKRLLSVLLILVSGVLFAGEVPAVAKGKSGVAQMPDESAWEQAAEYAVTLPDNFKVLPWGTGSKELIYIDRPE